jgi:tetratricopeptide (TPR) repeat protein
LEEASEALDRAARVEPDDALTHFRMGRLHEVQGDLSAAVPFFRRAAILADSQGWLWSHLGSALINLGDADEAREILERALELDPDNWLNHSRFGRLLELEGDIEASTRAVRLAIGMKPDEAWMWSHLGHLLVRQRLWFDAENAMQKALSIDPEDPVTKERLERLQELQNQQSDDHFGTGRA